MRRENCFQCPEYLLMVFPFPGTIVIGHRQMKTPKNAIPYSIDQVMQARYCINWRVIKKDGDSH